MKHELVPAQQARLSKLCIEELEKQLQESKTSLTNVLIEKENMKADLRKLEAKICFLEKNPLSQTPAEEPVTNVKTNVKPSLIAPAKLGASIASKKTTSIPTPSKKATSIPTPRKVTKQSSNLKPIKEPTVPKVEQTSIKQNKASADLKPTKEPATPKPAEELLAREPTKQDSSRRRSTRSSASLASYMIAESLSPDVTNIKKRSASRTDGNTSAKKARKILDDNVTKESDDREPLGCVTNSPCKKSSSIRTRVPKNGQKRNPEECKQQ